MNKTESLCKEAIKAMLKKSQTKVIFPLITYGLLVEYLQSGKDVYIDSEVRKAYHKAIELIQTFLGHKLHTGGKYYDAYPIRNLPRYGILKVEGKIFGITTDFKKNAKALVDWIPNEIKDYVDSKIGVIPKLGIEENRFKIAHDSRTFQDFIEANIALNPSNFEVFSFSILRVHLEKFACRIYRDTKTSAHDKGVDLSTNFGVVYQIKKLQLLNIKSAKEIFSEIKSNFDSERMSDGKVVLVIDDISVDVKKYFINMKIQSISKSEILKLNSQFFELEDRMKVLRVIYDEFRREYESQI